LALWLRIDWLQSGLRPASGSGRIHKDSIGRQRGWLYPWARITPKRSSGTRPVTVSVYETIPACPIKRLGICERCEGVELSSCGSGRLA